MNESTALSDIFIVYSNATYLSSAFSVQTQQKDDILHWVFSALLCHVFPVCVKIILIWWHFLLLRASVAVRRQMSLFYIYIFFFLIRDMLFYVPSGLQWWDQTGATERALAVERLRRVEQREECTGEECTTNQHNIHQVRKHFLHFF